LRRGGGILLGNHEAEQMAAKRFAAVGFDPGSKSPDEGSHTI
jgi:hypothetical protein